MKILMVTHQFLPRHLAGSEVYTYRLAQALQARGHPIHLFFTEIRPERPQYELTRGEFDGIPYSEAVHNRFFATFEHSYRDPDMERVFRQVLDQASPDVIHLQHLYLHSIGYIDIARSRNIPTLYTLHEYMLMCLNGGRLLRPGSVPCAGPDTDHCARCAAVTYPGVTTGDGAWLPSTVSRLAQQMRRAVSRRTNRADGNGDADRYRPSVRQRQRETKAALDNVDLFIAPSRYLRGRFVDAGLIRLDRIEHSDYGFFVDPFAHVRKTTAPTLRVGYVGTIAEFKGVHLILDAFRDIDHPGIECRIYGDLDTFPDFKVRLLQRPTPVSVRFMGRLPNDAVADAVAALDLLIVPSLWPENSPLTIHEAFLAGTPVLTADDGGMAELVQHGRCGLLFRSGDAADLRRQILRVLAEPGLLASLRQRLPPVKTIAEDAAQMEARYHRLLQARRPVS